MSNNSQKSSQKTCGYLPPLYYDHIRSKDVWQLLIVSVASLGCGINNLLPTWAQKIPCWSFDWMLQSWSGWAWKKCEQTLLFIAMHYWGSHHWRSMVGENCSSFPASSSQQSSNQGASVLHVDWSAPLRVSGMCRAFFTNTSCPLQWSYTVISSQWIRWWFSRACSATADD